MKRATHFFLSGLDRERHKRLFWGARSPRRWRLSNSPCCGSSIWASSVREVRKTLRVTLIGCSLPHIVLLKSARECIVSASGIWKFSPELFQEMFILNLYYLSHHLCFCFHLTDIMEKTMSRALVWHLIKKSYSANHLNFLSFCSTSSK